MTLSQAILEAHLQRPFRYFDSVGSSNDLAKTWLQDGAPEGAAVIANEQRQGRGRKGRAWQTPADVALAVSVILRPPARSASKVNWVGALAVYDLAESIGCDEIGIKWPNDVQVGGKKVAGILPEAVWADGFVHGVVLGVGINVRIDFSKTQLRETAISLESAVGRRLDRAKLLRSFLERMDFWYAHLDDSLLYSTWKKRLNMLGKRVTVDQIAGLALDVATDGSLLIAADDGQVLSMQAGDVFVTASTGAQ